MYGSHHESFLNHVTNREKRAIGERNVVALVLSKERCALISTALDDCKIAACRDEDRNPIKKKHHVGGEIPEGAICRVKCKSVKSQRCICCANGFEIGRECPRPEDDDSCNLKEDNRALYEGPAAQLFPAFSWRDCYTECNNRGMSCRAASYVKLRFNSMCWIFSEVTTRYADDVDTAGPGFGAGNTFQTRSLIKPGGKKGGKKKKNGIDQRPLLDIPDVMLPAGQTNLLSKSKEPGELSRSLGFRNPSFHSPQKVSIAKGDARGPEHMIGKTDEPEMMSWHRACN